MTDKKENRGGYRPEAVAANLKSWRIRGVKVFCGKTGYSLAFVKAVQATPAGAESFTDNEIDLLKFVKAANELLGTATDLPAGFATWKEFREMNEARIAEVKRLEAQKLVMKTSEVKRQVAEGVGLLFSELDRRDREQPPALAGRSAVEISERMKADTKSIKKNLEQKFQAIAK
jgi:hypothetical protein